jgi:hypothetical protein
MSASRAGTRSWRPTRRLPRGWRGLVLGGLRLRRRVKRRARDLDRQLAAGVDPMRSDELSLRVGQLGSAGARQRLEGALRRVIGLACSQPGPLARRSGAWEIQANQALLLELADAVGSDAPVGIQGLAKTWLMVHDDAPSPLYHRDASRPVAEAAIEALEALGRGHRTAGTSAV